MSQVETYTDVQTGHVIKHTADSISINGCEFLPAEVIGAAMQWVSAARDRGWALREPGGLAIDKEVFLRGFRP